VQGLKDRIGGGKAPCERKCGAAAASRSSAATAIAAISSRRCPGTLAGNVIAAAPEPRPRRGGPIRHNRALADSRLAIGSSTCRRIAACCSAAASPTGYRFPAGIAAKVRKPMLRIFPQLGPNLRTSALAMLGADRDDSLAGNILGAGSCSGHGTAMASLATAPVRIALRHLRQAAGTQLSRRLGLTQAAPGALAMAWYAVRDRL